MSATIDGDVSDFEGFQITGERDDDLGEVSLTGWMPGPAGIAELSLAGDTVSFVVDYAQPDQFCGLQYPIGSEAVAPLLDMLSGGNGEALGLAIDQLGSRRLIVWRGVQGPAARRFQGKVPPANPPALFTSLTRMAIVESQLASLERPELVEIADLLAYAAAGFAVPHGLDPTRSSSDALSEAMQRLEVVLASGDGLADVESTDTGNSLTLIGDLLDELADNVRGVNADLANRFEQAARAVGRMRVREVPSVDVKPSVASPSVFVGDYHRGLRDAESSGLTGRFDVEVRVRELFDVTARRAIITEQELTVSISYGAESFNRPIPQPGDGKAACWLRVYRHDDIAKQAPKVPFLVALAPFVPGDDTTMSAVAFIPPGEAVDQLICEVTDRPADLWQDRPEQLIRYAVTVGQSAARLSRSGNIEAASERWQTTSTAWAAINDSRRSQLASSYADQY